MTLAVDLADWTDWDVAAYHLGRTVGLFQDGDFDSTHQHVFWSDADLGNGLHEALLGLTRAGVLERRDEADKQFRWVAPSA
jgi:hypothetical protein